MEPRECRASWIPGLVPSGAHSRDPLGPSRNDENYERDLSSPRRNSARVLQNITPQKQRAQGKPGALAGTRSLACKMEEAHERSHHRSTGIPGLPCAMVLTVSFVLAPETGLVCLRRRPQCVSIAADLISASGYQAHTTSPSAFVPFVFRHKGVHRIPRPTFVTIAIRPSYRARDGAMS
jgi:hypothetical protein